MKVLHEIYRIAVGDDRYYSRLRRRLKNYFKEQISLVTPKYKTAEIVIPTKCLNGGFISHFPTRTDKAAVSYLRDKILNALKNLPELKWPPLLQELLEPNKNPPQSLFAFLGTLINQENHHVVPSTNLAHLAESFGQDKASAETRGKYMQRKHFFLGQRLYNFTDSRKVIDIAYKIGQSTFHNTFLKQNIL